MPEMTPDEAAALYVWAVGDGQREPPADPEEMRRVGRGLIFLTERAGSELAHEPVDLDGNGEDGLTLVHVVRAREPDGMDLAREFALEQRAREHAKKTGPTIGGEPALDAIRAEMRAAEAPAWRAAPDEMVRALAARAAVARARIVKTLNSLPFVRWDRCVRHDDGTVAYGWISRDDDRADFVVLEFDGSGEFEAFTSSSARYSRQLHGILIGDDGHSECERVSEVFGDAVENTVGS